jgi:hypothetical protein
MQEFGVNGCGIDDYPECRPGSSLSREIKILLYLLLMGIFILGPVFADTVEAGLVSY